ncbi:similar to Kazachstania africana KAFR_0A03070 hypothetical protein [Maudiozyma saulgeensis]|uniref:RNase III domain-containing protein n=1 Tax=Maudiozyma saulgeensis TaxID=1789683 RepID=A0A1X7R5U9_9SACH|nr:similar to Kazachstania africana KAFR_0A03070 hypothetical protein [Kazachstania saulgeensis]
MDNQEIAHSDTPGPNDSANIRKFYKVQTACAELEACMKTIYKYGLTTEDLKKLASEDTPVSNAIAESPAMRISSTLLEKKDSLDILALMEENKFSVNINPVDKFIYYPVISDPKLENLAFIHRSYPNMNVQLTETEKTIMCNERLEFLGDSWLGAFVAHIIYKKYPYADEGALSSMKDSIVNNSNLARLSEVLGFKERLKANIPTSKMKIKDKFSKHYADCVEAYIGALVVDRFGNELKEIEDWVAFLAEEQFKEFGPEMIKKPLNRNAKGELAELFQFNTVSEKLTYERLNTSIPFKVRAMLGPNVLAYAEGHNIREAEQRAAMIVLDNHDLLQKYCPFELEFNSSRGKFLAEESSGSDKTDSILSADHGIKPQNNFMNAGQEIKINNSESTSANTTPFTQGLANPTSQPINSSNYDINKLTEEVMSSLSSKLSLLVSNAVSEAMNKKPNAEEPVPIEITKPAQPSQPNLEKATITDSTTIPTESTIADPAEIKKTSTDGKISTPLNVNIPTEDGRNSKDSIIRNTVEPVTSKYASNSPIEITPPQLPVSTTSVPVVSQVSALSTETTKIPAANAITEEEWDKEAAQRLYVVLGSIKETPDYTVYQDEDTGLFNAVCLLQSDGQVIGEGSGRNKKLAKQRCASNALKGPELQELMAGK